MKIFFFPFDKVCIAIRKRQGEIKTWRGRQDSIIAGEIRGEKGKDIAGSSRG